MKINKKFKKNKKLYLVTGICAVVVVAVLTSFFVVNSKGNSNNNQLTSSEQQANENADTTDKAPASPTTAQDSSSASAATTPSTNQVQLTKPTLNKSSGNGPDHTIPKDVLVNFICNSVAGSKCSVILTSKTNPANVITLEVKSVGGTYGQPPFASWDWKSVAGNWSIVARATNGSGGSMDSDKQDLTVQ